MSTIVTKYIYRFNVIFKDVYREVGLLEIFVTCLHRYECLVKDKQSELVHDPSTIL